MKLLYVVATDRPDVAASLREAFAGEPAVEVRFDRRRGERRAAAPGDGAADRRGGAERRGDGEQARDLAILGYVRVVRPDR